MRHFRPISLVTWLGLGSVVIVAVAVIAVAVRSVDLLEEFAEREGLTRAQLAVASAHEYIESTHRSVHVAARLLARLPGLQRVIQTKQPAELVAYLKNFCRDTTEVDSCAILDGSTYLGVSDTTTPWAAVAAAYAEQGTPFWLVSEDGSGVVLGATSRVRIEPEGLRAVTLKRIDQDVMREIGEHIGAIVHLRSETAVAAGAADTWTGMHALASSEKRPVASRLATGNPVYAASMPIKIFSDDVATFIDVEIGAHTLDSLAADLVFRLGATALGIILITGLAAILYGRWLVRPVAALGKAAGRIGQGDFETEIPVSGVPEVVTLGTDMENMRRNLVAVTAALSQREAQAKAVLTGIDEGVFAVDMRRRISYMNPQAARMLQGTPEDALGQFCGDVLNPEPVNGSRPCDSACPILAARNGAGQNLCVERLRGSRPNARSMVVVSAAPSGDQQVQILRDETELEAVRRARDSVLANLTHEFRTPLAAQMASIELLHDKMEIMSKQEREQMIRNIQRGGVRLMQLIDNLLESVRIDAGQLSIRQQTVSLAEVIAESAALLKPLLDQREQQLDIRLPRQLPDVLGDELRLTQVFVNLLANAIKFAPESSEIGIGANFDDNSLTAWVENDGPAIADSDRSEIFEPFQRSLNGEPGAPGLGIGLWIVKSIVERHHGTVRIEMTPDRRTRFNIQLPIEDAA